MTRITVEIDDKLLEEAKRLTGARTRRATIEAALRDLIRRHQTAALSGLASRIRIRLTRRDLKVMRPAHPRS